MCLSHLFFKLLRVEWKASHLDKSLKQKSAVSRIFLKISEINVYSRKKSNNLYDGKICERVFCVIMFTCKWFRTFQWFILKFNKKVQSPRVPGFWVLSLGCWVLFPGSWIVESKFSVLILDYAFFDNYMHFFSEWIFTSFVRL